METMVLVLDESGAKGYAKTKETHEGEIGLMAGFLYTESEIDQIKKMLDRIVSPYYSKINGKFHITDLDKASQKRLRDEVFYAFRMTRLQWFFMGIYAEGFHQSEFDYGRGGSANPKELLHSELFKNMFIMSLIMSNSINKNDLRLIIKTDNIDQGVLNKFKKEGDFICDLFLGREREIFTHIKDKETGKFKKEIFLTRTESDNLPKFKNIGFDIICDSSSLTIAADILANSVNYYLRKNQEKEVGVFINNKEAIKDHPLVDLAFIPKNKDHVIPLLDVMYRRIPSAIENSVFIF
jgi:hypothetical protein